MSGSRGQDVVVDPPLRCQLVDLHNHTDASYDGSISVDEYIAALTPTDPERRRFDVLAITDHNSIDNALRLREAKPDQTIVGQEIDTADGELIGLFMTKRLSSGNGAIRTAEAIRDQGGLVYVQHPFYPFIRLRLADAVRNELADRGLVDIVEGLNGGPFMRWSDCRAREWAHSRRLPCGAGSDAHHRRDLGRCVTAIPHGELTAQALLERMDDAILVNRSRPSVGALGSRGRYAAGQIVGRVVYRRPRKLRVP